MRKLLWYTITLFMANGLYAGTITIPGDKATTDQLTATEWNTWKNRVGGVINGNIDTANIKTDGVGTTELVNDAVTPAKLDEDNTTVFTMKGLVVTDGVTASTMTTTSTGTFAVANITTIENSPAFTYGFTAATATINNLTVSTLTVNTLYTPGVQIKLGSFTTPGSTGEISVTGVGFTPRYVEFNTSLASAIEFRTSRGIMTYAGDQHSNSWAGFDDTQTSWRDTGACIYVKDRTNATTQRAIFVSMDADGFTINFTASTVTDDEIYWKAVR